VEAYKFVYPESEINLNEVAYFFDYTMRDTVPGENHEEFCTLLQSWKEAWEDRRPTLLYRRGPGWIEVFDQREEKPRHHWLYGAEALAYEACGETDHTAEAVWRSLGAQDGTVPLEDVQAALTKCCDLGIMIEEDGHYLSLALPSNRNWFLDHTGVATGSAAGSRILEPSISLGAD
jgi:hypothetical protein